MADSNAFGLFIWVDDRPIEANVLKLSRITTPFYFDNDVQERDYTSYHVGQNVVAKCLDGSKHNAIIGGIEDESNKTALMDVLRNTPMFHELIRKYVHQENSEHEVVVEKSPKKKEKTTKRTEKAAINNPSTPKKGVAENSKVSSPPKNKKSPKKKEKKEKTPTKKTDTSKPNNTTKSTPKKKTGTAHTPNEKISKRKKEEKTSTSPNKKKKTESVKPPSQKDLERIGEDLTLLNFSLNKQSESESPARTDATIKHATTPNLLRESLDLVNQGDDDIESFTAMLQDPHTSCHCKEVMARLDTFESHIQWLTSNIQHLYNTVSQAVGLLQSTAAAGACATNATKLETFEEETGSTTTPAKPGSSQVHDVPMSPSVQPSMSPVESGTILYRGYTKDMLRSKIRLAGDYRKATILLFRLLYSEDEIRGRSLKGKKTKTGLSRPGLEDLTKLDLIYELVGEKFPGTEREAINIKIGHLLKPSGTNQLCTRQKDDGARQNNDDD